MCNWHRNVTLIKKVLKSMKDEEKVLAMQDHCGVMHRMDRAHCDYYELIKHYAGDDELTIQDYFKTKTGQYWKDPHFLPAVQHYVKWWSVQSLATLTNTSIIKNNVQYMSETEQPSIVPYLDVVKHALQHINAFQVRIFVAMLYGMCTLEEILEAGVDSKTKLPQRRYDEVLNTEDKQCWADAFEIELRYYSMKENGDVNMDEWETKKTWCWPVYAPPSAMQCLLRHLGVTSAQCQWANHFGSGLSCVEGAYAEKISWWAFWRARERFCPQEQRATDKQVAAANRANKNRMTGVKFLTNM